MQYVEDISENAASITINGDKAVALSVPVSFAAGDIGMVFGQLEVTNPCAFNVGFGHYLVLANAPDAVLGSFFSRATMANVTPAEHHHVEKLSAAKKFTAPFNGYLNLVIYAVASGGSGALTVEQNYGGLQLVIGQ